MGNSRVFFIEGDIDVKYYDVALSDITAVVGLSSGNVEKEGVIYVYKRKRFGLCWARVKCGNRPVLNVARSL